ncbi:antibiotic biosynthesis monooxygenase family protein [Fictibacillus phosphorivorans]|uniref:antibiotic biosynthesis monooxygenase family protein n=1 Tax=Fictibacillus phosphorivorans TaxID=1221500 RepID=UPI00203AC1C7|nr:antibiotic biosynthesis monooxygenase [Fictibacillus phosphorivorans]MCM3717482.1 antibiotic biosynthesis monooxygenase [Fictibacillus phosphorivorans]MCM3775177.1 antibiotic biosynthesis monooxygenase [Fictibacillus phosphorivorans]
MKTYITYGTTDYLSSFHEKYSQALLLEGDSNSALVFETDGENPFFEKHEYEVINQRGNLSGAGFVIMNHVPVTEDGRSLFEERFQNRAGLVENEPGFVGIRILRPLHQDPYIIMTLWRSHTDFINWQQSKAYEEAHKDRGTSRGLPETLFSGQSYVKEYKVVQ